LIRVPPKLQVWLLLLSALLAAPAAAAGPLLELDQGTMDLGLTLSGEGQLRGTATLRGPTLRVSSGAAKSNKTTAAPAKKGSAFPLDVDKLVVHEGSIVFVSSKSPDRELIRIHGLELNVENFTNRKSDAGGGSTLISMKGRVGQAGQLALNITAERGRATPTFTGHAELTGLGLQELGLLADERLAMTPFTGKVSVKLDFNVRAGRIDGMVKPTLSGVGVGLPGVGAPAAMGELKSKLPAGVGDILGGSGLPIPLPGSGSSSGEKSAPLTVELPIHANLSGPQPELWTAIMDVLRTSVVEASSAGLFKVTPGIVR
jgi:hypothetical protein